MSGASRPATIRGMDEDPNKPRRPDGDGKRVVLIVLVLCLLLIPAMAIAFMVVCNLAWRAA